MVEAGQLTVGRTDAGTAITASTALLVAHPQLSNLLLALHVVRGLLCESTSVGVLAIEADCVGSPKAAGEIARNPLD